MEISERNAVSVAPATAQSACDGGLEDCCGHVDGHVGACGGHGYGWFPDSHHVVKSCLI